MPRDSSYLSVDDPHHFDPPRQNQSLSNANVPFAGPRPVSPHPQFSTPLPPQPLISLLHHPFLDFPLPTLPKSQQAAPPPSIPPPPTSLTYRQHYPLLAFSPLTVANPQLAIPPAVPPPPPHQGGRGMVPSHFVTPARRYNDPLQPPPNSTPRLPTPGLIPPSSLPRAPRKPHRSTKMSKAGVSSAGLSSRSPPEPGNPTPAILHSHTPSRSRVLTPVIPPATSPSSQPHLHPVGHRTRSRLAASSPSYHASRQPQNLLLPPPTPGLIPPSLPPPTSRVSAPQPHEPTFFEGAHDFTLNNPQFTNNSLGRPGLKELLQHSMPDAFYNSAARYPPPRCHFGTRNDYIAKITNWVLGSSGRREPILWMRGPFGVGKSAVAQSCAEVLQLKNKLAATLFFSRSNVNRDDPRRVFTSIAYQIATICPPFRDIVNARICDDPALALTSLSTQFEELIVRPLRQTDIVRSGIEGCVVIIDGLDECRGTTEQCTIIDIIAASARYRTTPFRWFITSRPEDPIIRTMNSEDVSPVLFHFELPVSRETDHEILIYLTDEFEKIRKRHHLPTSWPSEEALALLVDPTAGLWIYITTIVRFITDENSFGPEDQLCIVLDFLKDVSAKVGADNPLTEMDFFYTLILERVPLKIRTIVRKILLVYSTARDWDPVAVASVLDLTEEQFRRSCASIQSVVELRGSKFMSMELHFYHASFLDFMKDPKRSKKLCIYGDLVNNCRRECLDWVHQVCSRSTDSSHITFPSKPVFFRRWTHDWYYYWKLLYFWYLFNIPNHPIDLETAASFEKLQFRTMLRLLQNKGDSAGCYCFKDNLPTSLRDKIVRKGKCPMYGCTNTKDVLILGHGENETVTECTSWDWSFELKNNQDPRPGWCVCGSPIRQKMMESSDSDLLLFLED